MIWTDVRGHLAESAGAMVSIIDRGVSKLWPYRVTVQTELSP